MRPPVLSVAGGFDLVEQKSVTIGGATNSSGPAPAERSVPRSGVKRRVGNEPRLLAHPFGLRHSRSRYRQLRILRACLIQRRTKTQTGLIGKDRRRKDPKNQRSNQQHLAEPQQPRSHGIPSSRKRSKISFLRVIGGNLYAGRTLHVP